ncbi:MAG TPA: glycoside hydrolase family 15 protein [Thermoanaerobaculia bacterium]|nr:glycoside hydrolase family 15 protein [Thermoanaerobaculia bacterium]
MWAGLTAAAELANLFNEQDRRAAWLLAADEVRTAMKKHLWLENEGRFARGLSLTESGALELDGTVDSSAFATFYFGVFPPESALVEGTMRAIRDRLAVRTEIGGITRYENDPYHRIYETNGNPWILCTLWLAEHEVAKGNDQAALDLVRWARTKATPSMILPEQVDPHDGQHVSVAPLTWSHAQIVSIVQGCLTIRRKAR